MIDRDIVEAKFDIANHIIASERFERAESYAEMFLTLAKHHVISKELAENLARMARFRNLLVHRYWEISMEYIMEIVDKSLKDVEDFMAKIEEYMERKG